MPTSRRGDSTRVPSITTAPLVGRSSPATIMSRVLLPHPDGPRSETNSPARAAKLTEATASIAPVGVRKIFRTPAASISAAGGDPASGIGGVGCRARWGAECTGAPVAAVVACCGVSPLEGGAAVIGAVRCLLVAEVGVNLSVAQAAEGNPHGFLVAEGPPPAREERH